MDTYLSEAGDDQLIMKGPHYSVSLENRYSVANNGRCPCPVLLGFHTYSKKFFGRVSREMRFYMKSTENVGRQTDRL